MTLSRDIDSIRTQLWVLDLYRLTGETTPLALGDRLDATSLWIDAAGVPHQSKWYRLNRGLQVPQRGLVGQVAGEVDEAPFDVLHPVWRLLRNPDLSDRSIRRLVGSMPAAWQEALQRIHAAPVLELRAGRRLVGLGDLQRWTFLDALLLFACARRTATVRKEEGRVEALVGILYALPLLYCEEAIYFEMPIEADDTGESHGLSQFLSALDRGLGLDGDCGQVIQFPTKNRCLAIGVLQHLLIRHRSTHERALRTPLALRRFIASKFEYPTGGAMAVAFSAFRPAGEMQPSALEVTFPVDQRLWVWAWHQLARGDSWKFPRPSEVAMAWDKHLRGMEV